MTSPNGSGSDSIKIENSPKVTLTSDLPCEGFSHLGYPGVDPFRVCKNPLGYGRHPNARGQHPKATGRHPKHPITDTLKKKKKSNYDVAQIDD